MRETGTIAKIEGDIVTLKFRHSESCESCGSSFCATKDRVFEAKNSRALPLSEGETVAVYIPTGKTIGASFMLLIFPLLLFVLFFLGAGNVFPESGEGPRALAGLAGLAVGFGTSILLRTFRKTNDMPEVIEKVNEKTG